jgi:hypothetical protein
LTIGASGVKGIGVTNDSSEPAGAPHPPLGPTAGQPIELELLARAAVEQLAGLTDPEAFQALLRISALVGEALGTNARTLAAHGSWAKVAEVAGTSRQAAWARWSS